MNITYPNASWDGSSRISDGTSVSVIKQATYNGEIWCQLNNGNWVKARYVKEGVPSSDTGESFSGVATVHYVPGYGIALYQNAGGGTLVQENGQNRYLPDGTAWKVFKRATVNGVVYYNLGGNQWINGNYVVIS